MCPPLAPHIAAADSTHTCAAGIIQFCKDLGVDPSDSKTLLLAWKASGCWQGRHLLLHACSRFWHCRQLPLLPPLLRWRQSLTVVPARVPHPLHVQMGAKRQGFFSRAEFK